MMAALGPLSKCEYSSVSSTAAPIPASRVHYYLSAAGCLGCIKGGVELLREFRSPVCNIQRKTVCECLFQGMGCT